MTVEEFLKLAKSIYGDPFTLDNIFEIACAYKLFVPAEEKKNDKTFNWTALAYKYDMGGSPDAVSSRIGKYLSRHPEFVDYLNGKFFKDEEKKEVKKVYTPFNVASYKEKTQLKDLLNEYRKLVREDARIDDLKETIREAAKSVDTYVSKPCKHDIRDTYTEAVLLLSDWHIGVKVDNFYNTYNVEVAGLELENLVAQVKDYCRKFNIGTLHILNMGDLIHGDIHTNARIVQEFDVITQVEVAGQLLYKVLSELESCAPRVTYRSCSDNHARLMPNKSEHIEKENFGRLIDWWIEAKLEQGRHDIEIIDDNLDYGMGLFTLENGKKIMFAHGHEDPINQAYQNFTGATKEFIDYILLAHFHNPKEKAFQDCRVIVNGSLVGTEQYALSKRLFTSPCQKLLIFDDNLVDITIHTNIYRD